MYEFSPSPNKTPAYALVFICLFAGIFLFMPLSLGDSVMLWLRALGIWAFAGAFIVTDRYLLTSYTYIIEENENGGADFVVSELHFKKRRTVCRISVSDIAELSQNDKKHKFAYPKKARKYNYTAELLPDKYTVLRVEDNGNTAYIRFSPDEKMLFLIGKLQGRH